MIHYNGLFHVDCLDSKDEADTIRPAIQKFHEGRLRMVRLNQDQDIALSEVRDYYRLLNDISARCVSPKSSCSRVWVKVGVGG